MQCRSNSLPVRCSKLSVQMPRERRRGAKAARPSFAVASPALAKALAGTRAAHRRAVQARNRLQAKRARHDTRAWQVKRRERTRQLIELGGLVATADQIGRASCEERGCQYG